MGQDGVEEVKGELVSIDGDRRRRTPLAGEINDSAPVADGFVASVGGYRNERLFHVRSDGTRRELPLGKKIGVSTLVVDPSGRRLLVDGYGDDIRPMWIVDLRTGKTLVRREIPGYRYAVLWPSPNRILYRESGDSPSLPTFEVLNAQLESTGRQRQVVGVGYSQATPVGTQLALWAGGARFAVQNADGTRSRTTKNIRLSNTEAFAAAPGRTFDLPR